MHSALNFAVKLYNTICSSKDENTGFEIITSDIKADVYNLKKIILKSIGLLPEDIATIIDYSGIQSALSEFATAKIPIGYFIDYAQLRDEILSQCAKLSMRSQDLNNLCRDLVQILEEPAYSKENLLKNMLTDKDEAIKNLQAEVNFLKNEHNFVSSSTQAGLSATNETLTNLASQSFTDLEPHTTFFSIPVKSNAQPIEADQKRVTSKATFPLAEAITPPAFTLNSLSDTNQKAISNYLDMQSLSAFARTRKRNLRNGLALLLQQQKLLLHPPNIALTGSTFSMYLNCAPQLFSWGNNTYGQLGLGNSNICLALTEVEHVIGGILQIIGGDYYTFLLTDKGLWACGDNTEGQLGIGDNIKHNVLTEVKAIPSSISQIIIGGSHTLVLTPQGLWACGDNSFGQLGLGHNDNCNVLTPVKNIQGKILQVVAGNCYTLVLTDKGLWACGDNGFGQLGLGHNHHCNILTRVPNIPNEILQVVAGESHTLVLTKQGLLWACGNNEFGQLGLGHTNNSNILKQVPSIPDDELIEIVAGSYHTLALTKSHQLWACGLNADGQLGLGDNQERTLLTEVKPVPGKIAQLIVGMEFTFVLSEQGLWGCGYNDEGQLGLGHNNICRTLTKVKKLPPAIEKVFILYQDISKLKGLAKIMAKEEPAETENIKDIRSNKFKM